MECSSEDFKLENAYPERFNYFLFNLFSNIKNKIEMK